MAIFMLDDIRLAKGEDVDELTEKTIAHISDGAIHVTEEDKENWNGKADLALLNTEGYLKKKIVDALPSVGVTFDFSDGVSRFTPLRCCTAEAEENEQGGNYQKITTSPDTEGSYAFAVLDVGKYTAAQIDYYTKYIMRNPQWTFVGVYTDEGKTGVNTKQRDGFKEMIDDALNGKIDLIITKSVSRFARNTVDSLITVRKLKEHGVEVYFEKEGIYTFDSKGELLITIMSSLAQEESRSISENVTWGQRKRFADGKVSLPYKRFLGYERGEDGIPKIVESEAVIVRRIYSMFIDGKTPGAIAKTLTAEEIPTPGGKQNWRDSTVKSILTNEKYKGAALLQKCFTVDFLTKKKKVNEGEIPQYYVEHSHEAIIDPREFDMVQQEMVRRERIGNNYSGNSIFSSRIVCGDCGAFYGSKVWQSNTKYKRTVWQCNDKFKGDKKCATPHLNEDEIKLKFLKAYSKLTENRERLIEDCRIMQNALTDTTAIDEELKKLVAESELVSDLNRMEVEKNSVVAQDQKEYAKRYNEHIRRYEELEKKIAALRKKKEQRILQSKAIGAFMFEVLELSQPPTEFDTKLWIISIENVTVHSDGRMIFKFKNGTEIEM